MRAFVLSCLCALVWGGAAAAQQAAPGEAPEAALAQFSWMAGHWRHEADGTVAEEGWFGPAGAAIPGIGRIVSANGATSIDYMRIEAGADGMPPAFVAQPGGRPPTRFHLTESGEMSAIFTNPDHDFPQVIHYWREGDTLHAVVSDLDGEQSISQSWELAP